MPTTLEPMPMATDEHLQRGPESVSLAFLFWTFFKVGSLSFGGFMSLIAMVETSIVKQKKLLTHEEMLDGISLASLMPGPQAVNVVAYVGYRLRKARGALVAATAVVLPSFVLMIALAALYEHYGRLEVVDRVFHGLVPAVAAVILSVVWRMAKQTVKGPREVALVAVSVFVLLAVSLQLFGLARSLQIYATFAVVVATGFAGYVLFRSPPTTPSTSTKAAPRFPAAKLAIAIVAAIALATLGLAPIGEDPGGVAALGKTFGGLSVMLFGGGYVFIPMIQQRVVEEFHWLDQKEFVDCIALSLVTPGPILVAATFIGYRVAGLLGATVSTIAIFSPPAFLMVRASQALDWFKTSAAAKSSMRGIRCGVIGMIFVAAYVVLRSALPTQGLEWRHVWPSLLIAGGALYALIRHDVDVVYVVPTGGLIGYFLYP